MDRIVVVKKSEVVGDRCLRLADLFVKNLVESGGKKKDKAKTKDNDGDIAMEDEEEEEEFVETSATRVVLRILNHLMQFLSARERTVRYRTSQFMALLLSNSLPTFPFDYCAISTTIFQQLRTTLTQRLQDKEAIVRVQAAIGLVRLMEMGVCAASDAEESDDGEGKSQEGISGILIEAMQNDPSADVRRTILYNLSPTSANLPYLLERSRDVDAPTRRAVFTRLLPTLGDFRFLSINMREKLLRWGLNDRDESVRQAAKKMFSYRWVDDAGGDLLEVLERLDIGHEPPEGGDMSLAMQGFWENRKDVLQDLKFDNAFWENLTLEGAFLARSFNDYCRTAPPQEIKGVEIDECMPEVTRLAFYLAKYINRLVIAADLPEAEPAQDQEFIVLQLLHIALTMDYGDEIGRRRMFALFRESLGVVELNEPVTKLIVEGLKKLTTSEGDFSMLMLEVIAEVHDTIAEDEDEDDGEDSFHSAQSDPAEEDLEDTITVRPKTRPASGGQPKPKKQKLDNNKGRREEEEEEHKEESDPDMEPVDSNEEEKKAFRELQVNLKCLHIAQFMLENISAGLKSNSHVVSLLNGLIVPAVRSHEVPIREAGMRCLGLSCLIDRGLAESNMNLFGHCFAKGHEALQIEALHIISDILHVHGASLFASEHCSLEQRQVYRLLAKATKMGEDESEEVQATAVEVICKLMLAQVIQDEELLKVLVTAYFDPATVGNHTLRQILSYFLPVFCHSSSANALMMANIAVDEFHRLFNLRLCLDGEDQEMVSATVIAAHLLDWTDPRKTVSPRAGGKLSEKVVDATPHAIIARDALEKICFSSTAKEERKLLANAIVAKCYIPKEAGKVLLTEVYDTVTQAIETKVMTTGEASGRNVLAKVEVSVGKLLSQIQEEEGGDATMVRGEEETGGEEDEEEEEGDVTIVPETKEAGEEEEEAEVDQGEESERTPAVTEDEEED
ncbi:hypothetical protein K440DRAFT_577011 [Wilcoxina mikolae CBS 423.85]|nr:hypothetical protein K440DRAFT_577011 [Wilcoxina mikolae CBS 423.85]